MLKLLINFKVAIVKKLLLVTVSVAASGFCFAQDMGGAVGRVISSTPVMQPVGVPRQVCSTEEIEVRQQKSGGGAAIGAIAGGALGNAVGQGAGRAAATVLGVIGGAIVGDRIEGAPSAQYQNVQRCSMQTAYENRAVGYNVVYELGGRQYAVQMPQDPGPTIQLQVSAVGASTQMAQPYNNVIQTQPVYVQPSRVIVTQPAYPVYYTRPYYPPVSIELGYGYWGGGGYRGHGHWR
jgi:uncharacterized protein YcfJ